MVFFSPAAAAALRVYDSAVADVFARGRIGRGGGAIEEGPGMAVLLTDCLGCFSFPDRGFSSSCRFRLPPEFDSEAVGTIDRGRSGSCVRPIESLRFGKTTRSRVSTEGIGSLGITVPGLRSGVLGRIPIWRSHS